MKIMIKQSLISSDKYFIKAPHPMIPRFITVHHTGNDDSAEKEIAHMINDNQVSYHFAVDNVEAVQGLPLNRNGWHVGDGVNGIGNRHSIGVKICYSKSGGAQFIQAEKNAAWLVAKLMRDHSISLLNVRMPQSWNNEDGAHCILSSRWQQFLNRVQAEFIAGNTTCDVPGLNDSRDSHVENLSSISASSAFSGDVRNPQMNKNNNYHNNDDFAPGRVIVGMRGSSLISPFGLNQLFPQINVVNVESLMDPQATQFSVQEGQTLLLELAENNKQSVIDAIDLLKAQPDVDFAEPDYLYYGDDSIVDSSQDLLNPGSFSPTSLLWNMRVIRVAEAWNVTRGSRSIRVGVIDSGVDNTNPSLTQNVDTSLGFDFVLNRPNGMDVEGHGTHIAGIIGATPNNNYDVVGVAPDVVMISLRVLSDAGNGRTSGYITDMVKAISRANALGLDIINYSISGDNYSQAVENAIRAFNGLFVVSAGNNSRNIDINPRFPAALNLPNMITVGNSDQSNQRASDSNYGRTSVDLFAPGTRILSTGRGNTFVTRGGTSMSVPHVVGAAVLALSKNRALSPVELKQAILGTVTPAPAIANLSITGGILNAGRLMEYVKNSMSVVPPPTLPPSLSLGIPRNLRITNATTTSLTLEWDAPTNVSNITGYEIFRNGIRIGEVDIRSPRIYIDTRLVPDSSYSYTVRSYATSNNSNVATGRTVSEVVTPPPPPPMPGQGIFYRVNGAGSNRQTLVISNRSSNNIPTRWRLQFDFSGTTPNVEFPATWTRPTGNRVDTTVGAALNAGASVSIPMQAGANTRLYNVTVNGIVAMQE